jgi:hypothetical protein
MKADCIDKNRSVLKNNDSNSAIIIKNHVICREKYNTLSKNY